MNEGDEGFDNSAAGEYEAWIDAKPEPLAPNFQGWLTEEFNKAAGKNDNIDQPPTKRLHNEPKNINYGSENLTPKDAEDIQDTLPPRRINSPKP